MFEKEVEQFSNDKNIILEDAQIGNSPFDADEVFNKEMKAYLEDNINTKAKHDQQKDANFGYNKANEWHFVKDGDLPKDDESCWSEVATSYDFDDFKKYFSGKLQRAK